eukprot:4195987-Pleurochrysis_carterae.AAC.1
MDMLELNASQYALRVSYAPRRARNAPQCAQQLHPLSIDSTAVQALLGAARALQTQEATEQVAGVGTCLGACARTLRIRAHERFEKATARPLFCLRAHPSQTFLSSRRRARSGRACRRC